MSWWAWLGKLFSRPGAETKPEPYWALVEPYWYSVSINDGPEAFLDQFERLPEPSKHLFAAHWLVSEVANGGFFQLFGNSTGVLAPEAVEGLKAIGMPRAAAIAEEAMSWFESDYPRDRDARESAMEIFDQAHLEDHEDDCAICSIDDRFYALMANENGGFEEAANHFAKQYDQ